MVPRAYLLGELAGVLGRSCAGVGAGPLLVTCSMVVVLQVRQYTGAVLELLLYVPHARYCWDTGHYCTVCRQCEKL